MNAREKALLSPRIVGQADLRPSLFPAYVDLVRLSCESPAPWASMPSPDPHFKDDGRIYEEVAFADLDFDDSEQMYYYECPCGDLFEISQADLDVGERIAKCPSCSLRLRVLMPEDAQTPQGAVAEVREAEDETESDEEFERRMQEKYGTPEVERNSSSTGGAGAVRQESIEPTPAGAT